jgi:hypothetical protein
MSAAKLSVRRGFMMEWPVFAAVVPIMLILSVTGCSGGGEAEQVNAVKEAIQNELPDHLKLADFDLKKEGESSFVGSGKTKLGSTKAQVRATLTGNEIKYRCTTELGFQEGNAYLKKR